MNKSHVCTLLALSCLWAGAATIVHAQAQPPATAAATAAAYPFRNPDLPLEERVNNVLSLMTIEEKIAFLTQSPGLPRLGIRTVGWVEGLHGVALGAPGNWSRNSPVTTTTFSQSIGLGETWDADIVRQAGAIEGYETRYVYENNAKYRKDGLVVRTPNADLGRDPRWGRTEECYGEDAFLNGSMAVAFIKGLQGDDPKYWQAASLVKHFLANENENGRTRTSSDFDDRLFYEYYSMPFHMAFVEGGAKCLMASYNLWNKVPMTANPVIRNVLIKEWGVDGMVSTDAGGLPNLVGSQHYYPDNVQATAGAIKAGINQFLDRPWIAGATAALQTNLLTEADIDTNVKGVLRVIFRLGVLDPADRCPYAKLRAVTIEPWTTQKNKDTVRLATQEAIVLLKNKGNLLPLDKTAVKSIALIGPRANTVDFDWYSSQPPYSVTPMAGVKAKVGEGVNVQYAAGTNVDAAVALAKASDIAIVCVGNNPNQNNSWNRINDDSEGREGRDRVNITLGSGQEDLVKAVLAANPRTVVVLKSSFPYAIGWIQENAPAIVHMAHNSQEEGNALADVLFGDYNPAGRLVQTWPKSLDQVPPIMDYNIRNGHTYMYFKGEPLYPFGFGLSYTTFEYSNLKTSAPALSAKGSIDISVDVKNTGARAGDEVVQLYVKHVGSAVERPNKELRGFKRVQVPAGQTKTVTLTLPASRLAYWNTASKSWVVENDQVQLMIGASSAETKLDRTIDVTQ
ncbi:MAG: glycoside hydrolase family 3 C-terminal domain-containing protein [Verrucomicrobiota bacterium]|jgi:beta-glucosidase